MFGAVLLAGSPAWASHYSSARLWDYSGVVDDPIEITTLLERQVRIRGIRAHRSGTLHEDDLRIVGSIPTLSAARTIVDLSSRKDDRVVLHRRLGDLGPTDSELELRVLHLLVDAGLPRPVLQHRVVVDGRRQNDLVTAGWTVLRFTSRSTDAEIHDAVHHALFGRSLRV